MAVTAIRTVVIYVFLIVALRVTGKRQLGELQPIELVVTLLISDLASIPMQQSGTPLLTGLVPIAVLVAMELILSAVMMKSNAAAKLISGNPIVLIKDGVLSQKALKQLRMTIEDLMETLRAQQVFDIKTVRYAIAETNGSISIFTEKSGAFVPVINDGALVDWGMQMVGVDAAWVEQTVRSHHCKPEEVLLLSADREHHHTLIRKEGRTP